MRAISRTGEVVTGKCALAARWLYECGPPTVRRARRALRDIWPNLDYAVLLSIAGAAILLLWFRSYNNAASQGASEEYLRSLLLQLALRLAAWASAVVALVWRRAFPVILTIWASAALAWGVQSAFVSVSWQRLAASILGGIFCIAVVKRLELGIIAAVVLAASIIHPDVVPRPVTLGGKGPRVTELLILFMLVIVYVRACYTRRFEFFRSPLTVPLLLFFVSVIVSMVVSYQSHLRAGTGPWDFHNAYNLVRPIMHYLLFFAVAFGIRTEAQLRIVLRTVVWIGVIVAILMVAQQFVGQKGVKLFIGGPVTGAYVFKLAGDVPEEQVGDVLRFAAPGLSIILFLFLLSLTRASYGGLRVGAVHTAAAAMLGIGLIFSFTRHFWISTALSVVLISLFVERTARHRLILFAATAVAVAVISGALMGNLAPGSAGGRFAVALRARFASILEPEKTLRSESLENRASENRYAWRVIKQHPIFGIGVGNAVSYKEWAHPYLTTRYLYPVYWIHCSWLELWMVYGLLGVLSYVWLSVAFLARSFLLFRRSRDPSRKAVAISLFAAYIGFLERSITQMHILHDPHHIVAMALIWGIVEVMWRLHAEEEERVPEVEQPGLVHGLPGRGQPRRVPQVAYLQRMRPTV